MARMSLLGLPSELIQHILSFLQPTEFAVIAQVCRRLNTETHEESLWHSEINAWVRASIPKPATVKSFRELYIAHHPNWYILQSGIWFGDSEPSGKLLVTRYDEETGSINAYSAHAMKTTHGWTEADIEDNRVLIHTFDPMVSLDVDRPVLKLNVDSPEAEPPNVQALDRTRLSESVYSREIMMDTATESGLYSSFMLCRRLPEVAISEGTKVWPPQRFPAMCRTRNASHDRFNSIGHKPTKLRDVSKSTFRLRKWVEYRRSNPSLLSAQLGPPGNQGVATAATLVSGPDFFPSFLGDTIRMPEDVTTYGTLPEWCFQPTPQKPWQGVWCGDYSGHGCEFILIQQPDKDNERPLPRGMDWLRRWFAGDRQWNDVENEVDMENRDLSPWDSSTTPDALPSFGTSTNVRGSPNQESANTISGRLEAIKLTGDANVPRGEYTFIAPEVGDSGMVRVAEEEPFKGVRVVRSAGHIAHRGFQVDSYIPSQLFLISDDCLAHYWEEFSSISYFRRVKLEELMRQRPSVV